MALRFRACPRCSGDIYYRSDHYGNYRECLQCGHVQDVQHDLPVSFKVKLHKGRQRPGRSRTGA